MWYPRLGLPLPFELINTSFVDAGQSHDVLASPRDLDAWLRLNREHFATRLPAASTPGDVVHFRKLRQVLRDIFTAISEGVSPRAKDLSVLNEISAAAPQFLQVEWTRNRRHARLREVSGNPHVTALAAVARVAIELLGGPDVERISRCNRPGCVLLFLKDRRNSQWCSATCGNRARVARHYARSRQQSNSVASSTLVTTPH